MAYTQVNKMDQISSDLAQIFIKALKEDRLPFDKGFDDNFHLPFNPATGTVYKGTSCFILLCNKIDKGYEDPRYMTFNNAKDLGGHVRKGEKGVACVRFQPKTINVTDKDGKVILDEKGEPEKRELLIPCPYTVFNVEQIEGLEHVLKPLTPPDHQWEPHERAEALIKNSQAVIKHSDHWFTPCYMPIEDEIRMPERKQFHTNNDYYGVLMHELCHWTGHKSRLNRFKTDPFEVISDPEELKNSRIDYAKEELRAEIGSSILCTTIGVYSHLYSSKSTFENIDPIRKHKSYIQSWIKILENDPREILKATAQADKIASYLRQYDIVKEKPNEPLLKPYSGKVPSRSIENVKQQAIARIDLNVKQRTLDFSQAKPTQDKSIPTQLNQSSLER